MKLRTDIYSNIFTLKSTYSQVTRHDDVLSMFLGGGGISTTINVWYLIVTIVHTLSAIFGCKSKDLGVYFISEINC